MSEFKISTSFAACLSPFPPLLLHPTWFRLPHSRFDYHGRGPAELTIHLTFLPSTSSSKLRAAMSLDTSRYPLGFKSTLLSSSSSDPDLVSLAVTKHETEAPIFVLTLLSAQTPDNRLTPQFLSALLAALNHVEDAWDSVLSATTHGAALVVTGTISGKTSKFFSNGLDFESAIADPNFFDDYLFPVYDKLLTFPIPVVASVGGHAFAAGWGLVSACDFAVMGKKGYMCMNEVSAQRLAR